MESKTWEPRQGSYQSGQNTAYFNLISNQGLWEIFLMAKKEKQDSDPSWQHVL